jgi:isopenicillin N synthase-like dioxygenase
MSVPVIDLTTNDAGVVEQVGAACERIGFFTITNHGVPAEVIEGAWRAAPAFFDRPEAEKMALALGDREGLLANLAVARGRRSRRS